MVFDSDEQDPRDYLKTEYGGLTLHIKPGHGDEVSRVSPFLEDSANFAEAHLTINRFLSAMAWKEGKAFASLGAMSSGASPTDRDKPRFNYGEGRVFRYAVISRFDFEHLQNPPNDKQKLALALYREGLNSYSYDVQFYRFLSFFKILNIKFSTGKAQIAEGTAEESQASSASKSPTEKTDEVTSTPSSPTKGNFGNPFVPTKGHIYGNVSVEATDLDAAKVLAERKLRLRLDALNYFGDFFTLPSSRVTLPGDATLSDVKSFIYSQTTKHTVNEFANFSLPFSFASIGGSGQKVSAFERVNSMLANPNPSALEDRILSSLQWAGRASIESRREEAFLLFCISLEALLLSRRGQNIEITQTFSLRGAHLLVKDAAHRREVFDDLKYLYGIRSNIVHSGRTRVADADLSKIRWLAKTALFIMLVREPFSLMKEEEEFEAWFQAQLLAGTTSVSTSPQDATGQGG